MYKIVLSFKGRIQKVLIPKHNNCTIGSDTDNDICIDNLAVAGHHARLSFEDRQVILDILDQEHALQVNNIKPAKAEGLIIKRGDEITIGKHTLTCLWESELTRAEQTADTRPVKRFANNGWLQIMSGPKMGRTVQLNKPTVQIGANSSRVALITNRKDGYYLSILDNNIPVKVNCHDIGDSVVPLHDGNTISVGDMELLFFTQE